LIEMIKARKQQVISGFMEYWEMYGRK
jgi:hypothetical protein